MWLWTWALPWLTFSKTVPQPRMFLQVYTITPQTLQWNPSLKGPPKYGHFLPSQWYALIRGVPLYSIIHEFVNIRLCEQWEKQSGKVFFLQDIFCVEKFPLYVKTNFITVFTVATLVFKKVPVTRMVHCSLPYLRGWDGWRYFRRRLERCVSYLPHKHTLGMVSPWVKVLRYHSIIS